MVQCRFIGSKIEFGSVHCDTPWRRRSDPFDLSQRYPRTQVDIPKMRDGGVSGIFFAIYNSGARGATPEKFDDAMAIIDSVDAVFFCICSGMIR